MLSACTAELWHRAQPQSGNALRWRGCKLVIVKINRGWLHPGCILAPSRAPPPPFSLGVYRSADFRENVPLLLLCTRTNPPTPFNSVRSLSSAVAILWKSIRDYRKSDFQETRRGALQCVDGLIDARLVNPSTAKEIVLRSTTQGCHYVT